MSFETLLALRKIAFGIEDSDADCGQLPRRRAKAGKNILRSSKHGGTGTGTVSVRAIAARYDGQAQFMWKNGVFSASVVLTLPEEVGGEMMN